MVSDMKRLSLLALLLVAACAPKPGQTRVQTALAALHDPSSKYVVVVAHRGDWRNYPENSIPAIESCIRMGVDMMELDLKLTKDSVLVLSHDHTLNRCTTGSGRISDYTYEEILQFDLKAGHGIGRPGIKMPTLREALEVCKDRILVNVDQGYDYYDQVLAITEELGVTASDEEIDALIEEHKTINGERRSDEAFEGIVRDNFGLTMKDYRRLVMLSLAKRKVAEAVDSEAKELSKKIYEKLKEVV